MKKILVSILLFVFSLCLVGCDTNMTSLPQEMPEDFSFTLTFGFDGYYDSKTGALKNGYNHDLGCECVTTLQFSKDELKEISNIRLKNKPLLEYIKDYVAENDINCDNYKRR